MLIVSILLSVLCALSNGQSFGVGSPKEIKDLTSEKYSGPDEDLRNFEIQKMSMTCDRLVARCAMAWKQLNSRRAKVVCKTGEDCGNQDLKNYTINFLVKDRRGATLVQKSYKYDSEIAEKEGYVKRNLYSYSIRLGDVNLNLSTVSFWVDNIKWKSRTDSGVKKEMYKGATTFSLEEQLRSLNPQEKQPVQED